VSEPRRLSLPAQEEGATEEAYRFRVKRAVYELTDTHRRRVGERKEWVNLLETLGTTFKEDK
jgi:DNA-binding PadR family transcriptional regulator